MCEHDSGSSTGCRPACDDRATRVLTYRTYGPALVTRLCDYHANRLPGRIYPYTASSDVRL